MDTLTLPEIYDAGPPFEPLALVRDGCKKYIGGARGVLAWLRYCEQTIEMDPEGAERRIKRCEAMNLAIRARAMRDWGVTA